MLKEINRHSAIITSIYEDFNKSLKPLDEDFLQFVKDYLDNFDTLDGKIIYTERNVDLLLELEQKVLEKFGNEYSLKANELLRRIPNVTDSSIELAKNLQKLDVSKLELKPLEKYILDKAVTALDKAGIAVNVIRPIKDVLHSSIVNGYSIRSVKQIFNKISKGEIAGQEIGANKIKYFQRYGSQIAEDAVSILNGSIQNEIQTKYNLPNIVYVGGKVKGSRPICSYLVEKYKGQKIPLEEIAKLLKAPPKTFKGNLKEWKAGLMPNTTAENFTTNRGGYRCLHEAYATL